MNLSAVEAQCDTALDLTPSPGPQLTFYKQRTYSPSFATKE